MSQAIAFIEKAAYKSMLTEEKPSSCVVYILAVYLYNAWRTDDIKLD
jgi:hypothetical protein